MCADLRGCVSFGPNKRDAPSKEESKEEGLAMTGKEEVRMPHQYYKLVLSNGQLMHCYVV